jgi:proline iminopeptidase
MNARILAVAILAAAQPLQAQTPTPKPPPPVAGVAKTLARPDLVLHYADYGQGEPVLLIVGGPGLSGEWLEPVAQVIAKQARAILPDPRGGGKSLPKEDAGITLDATLADFEALRAELGLTSWTVLGHSWGGMLALDYAAKYPASVKALVLLDSGGTSWASMWGPFMDNITSRMTPDERAARQYWSQKEVYDSDPYRAEVEIARYILPAYFYDRAKALPLLAALKAGKEHLNPAAGRLIGEYDKGAAARVEALGKVDIPTLILHGRQDPMPESVTLENQKLLKGSRLVWLDRCGHNPWLEQPEAMEKALLEFLAGNK